MCIRDSPPGAGDRGRRARIGPLVASRRGGHRACRTRLPRRLRGRRSTGAHPRTVSMTTTDQRVDPLAEPGPAQDRAGLLGGLALGAVMLVVALTVALTCLLYTSDAADDLTR